MTELHPEIGLAGRTSAPLLCRIDRPSSAGYGLSCPFFIAHFFESLNYFVRPFVLQRSSSMPTSSAVKHGKSSVQQRLPQKNAKSNRHVSTRRISVFIRGSSVRFDLASRREDRFLGLTSLIVSSMQRLRVEGSETPRAERM